MRGQAFFRAKAGHRDANHAAIRDGLRKLGHFVVDLAAVGGGVPDLLVWPKVGPGRTGSPVFLEIKVAKGRESGTQIAWRVAAGIRGVRSVVVRTLDEALAAAE